MQSKIKSGVITALLLSTVITITLNSPNNKLTHLNIYQLSLSLALVVITHIAMDVENRLQNRLCVLVFILVAALVHTETLKRVYM